MKKPALSGIAGASCFGFAGGKPVRRVRSLLDGDDTKTYVIAGALRFIAQPKG